MSETTSTSIPAPGQTIFIACKKCETDRYHKVLAHTGETKAKVQCEVCNAKKTYTLPKPKKTRVSKPRKSKTSTSQGPTWDALKNQIGSDEAVPYSMKANFKDIKAIKHPSFGLGFITTVTPSKIDVVFEDTLRSLVHNRLS